MTIGSFLAICQLIVGHLSSDCCCVWTNSQLTMLDNQHTFFLLFFNILSYKSQLTAGQQLAYSPQTVRTLFMIYLWTLSKLSLKPITNSFSFIGEKLIRKDTVQVTFLIFIMTNIKVMKEWAVSFNALTCNSFAITDSMSSPTYPACVRAVQSQIAKGTSKHRAIVCANSVLPGWWKKEVFVS